MPNGPVSSPAGWTDPRHRRGLAGELAASRYLQSIGWTIVAHRYRYGHHDIDLIARCRDLVAFIEVKARCSVGFGRAVEAIGWRKRRDIGRVAAIWTLRFGRPEDTYRFDLIGVEWGGEVSFPEVTHIEDAWRC